MEHRNYMSRKFPRIHETCLVSGRDRTRKIGMIGRYPLFECTQCGLQFIDPAPDEKALRGIYSDYYKAWDLENFQAEVSKIKKNFPALSVQDKTVHP